MPDGSFEFYFEGDFKDGLGVTPREFPWASNSPVNGASRLYGVSEFQIRSPQFSLFRSFVDNDRLALCRLDNAVNCGGDGSAPKPAEPWNRDEGNSSLGGAIVGGVIGGLAVVIIAVLVVLGIKKKRAKQKSEQEVTVKAEIMEEEDVKVTTL